MGNRKTRQYPTGVRSADGSIEIWFKPKEAQRRYERLPWPGTPANLEKAGKIRKKIIDAIKHGTFVYRDYFPDSPHAYTGTESTFAEYSQAWLDNPQNDWKPQTREKFRGILQRVWIPTLHHYPPRQITHVMLLKALTNAIQNHKNRYKTEPAKSTQNDWLVCIRGAFDMAVSDKALDRYQNPCDGLSNKKRDKKIIDPFDIQEAELIISHITQKEGPIWGSWFELGFFSGIRYPSEINPLRWDDIDFRKCEMRINKIWTPRGIQDTTKNGKDRIVHLNSRSMNAFKKMKTLSPSNSHSGIIYTGEDDSPVHSANGQRKMWRRALLALGIRYRKMYNMRHTFATFGLMCGVNPAFMASQLGHSVEVFFSTYSKWINTNQNALQIDLLELGLGALKNAKCGENVGNEPNNKSIL